MASLTKSQLLLSLAVLLLSSLRTARSAPNTVALPVLCNGAVYGFGDPFATSLAYVLSELLSNMPSGAGHGFYNISPYPNAFAHGHAARHASLTCADCASCLGSAMSLMNGTYGDAIGARAVLLDCRCGTSSTRV